MNVYEELEQSLTPDQAQLLGDLNLSAEIEASSSTQQLLDEMLGLFEDDDSTMLLAHGISPELYVAVTSNIFLQPGKTQLIIVFARHRDWPP